MRATTAGLTALVAESRARCDLPAKITDPATLRTLAGLFETTRESKSRTTRRTAA